MRLAEIRFMEAVASFRETSVRDGPALDYARMMQLIAERWGADDPQAALTIGQPAGVAAAEPDAVPSMDADDPAVRLTWGGLERLLTPHAARGWGVRLLMAAEVAESTAYVRQFFGRATDKALAEKIVAKLIPGLTEYRRERVRQVLDALDRARVSGADVNPPAK